jgi:alanine-synthesizing transaminase
VPPPKATMFVWARIPEPFAALGSLEFTKLLLKEAGVALSPGIGFGPMGEGFVRFSLIEEIARTNEATRRIGEFFRNDRILSSLPAETANV